MLNQKKIEFVDVTEDLCETCANAYTWSKEGGGCPVWPTLKITTRCTEYNKK